MDSLFDTDGEEDLQQLRFLLIANFHNTHGNAPIVEKQANKVFDDILKQGREKRTAARSVIAPTEETLSVQVEGGKNTGNKKDEGKSDNVTRTNIEGQVASHV